MTALHAATANPLTRELVADTMAEFDRWAALYFVPGRFQTGQAYNDAQAAVYDLRTEIEEHLQIRFALTLTTFAATEADDD